MLLQISSCLLTAWAGPPVEILPRQWWLLIWLRSTTSPPPRSSFPADCHFEDAHADLIVRSAQKTSLAGLGTTCIAILRSSNKLGMVHIGDSRAYLLRSGTLTQITHDHTLVQYLVDKGEITPEEAEHHPKRNVIMRNIGDTPEPLEIDKSIREAIVGDRWLLCSDGLFGVVQGTH